MLISNKFVDQHKINSSDGAQFDNRLEDVCQTLDSVCKIKEMLDDDVTEESSSPLASPVI